MHDRSNTFGSINFRRLAGPSVIAREAEKLTFFSCRRSWWCFAACMWRHEGKSHPRACALDFECVSRLSFEEMENDSTLFKNLFRSFYSSSDLVKAAELEVRCSKYWRYVLVLFLAKQPVLDYSTLRCKTSWTAQIRGDRKASAVSGCFHFDDSLTLSISSTSGTLSDKILACNVRADTHHLCFHCASVTREKNNHRIIDMEDELDAYCHDNWFERDNPTSVQLVC